VTRVSYDLGSTTLVTTQRSQTPMTSNAPVRPGQLPERLAISGPCP